MIKRFEHLNTEDNFLDDIKIYDIKFLEANPMITEFGLALSEGGYSTLIIPCKDKPYRPNIYGSRHYLWFDNSDVHYVSYDTMIEKYQNAVKNLEGEEAFPQMRKKIDFKINTTQQILDSIHPNFFSDKVANEVEKYVTAEIQTMLSQALRAYNPIVYMGVFNTPYSGDCTQIVCDFSVVDSTLDYNEDEYNWHGQNMSQIVYAGCIAISRYNTGLTVSSHH